MTVSPRQLAALVREANAETGLDQQETPWSCGPAALAMAATALGRFTSERVARDACKTDGDGTDEHQLESGAKILGLDAVPLETDDTGEAFESLYAHLVAGGAAVLAVDGWSHWVAVAFVDENGYTVMDPDAGPMAQVSAGDLDARWRNPPEERPYYALLLSR